MNNLINLRFLFLSFGASALFVSIDVMIQYYFGSDLFGFEGSGRRLAVHLVMNISLALIFKDFLYLCLFFLPFF